MIPWSPRLLRFPDRAAFLAAVAETWPGGLGTVPAEEAALVELGVLRHPAVITGPAAAPVETPGGPYAGWHVRALFAGEPPAALAAAEIEDLPAAPVVAPGYEEDGGDT